MDKTDRLMGLLYLINLFEPVNDTVLKAQYRRFAKAVNASMGPAPTYTSLLESLKRRGLIVQTKGRYSLTGGGLRKIALAGLSRARDKNRLFNLKGFL